MRSDGSWGTRVYIPEYLAKAPPRDVRTRLVRVFVPRPFRPRYPRVRKPPQGCMYVCMYTCIHLHVGSDARGTNTETRFSRCGYRACLKHVCARNPDGESHPVRPLAVEGSFERGLTTPSRGGTNPLAFAVPLGPTMPPLSSSALIIRRYTTNSATMALRETPESSCHGTRAATGDQRHC